MIDVPKRIVVALGGNAISVPGEQGTIEQQFAHTRDTVRVLCDVIQDGSQLIITHGNGPQVGNVLRRVEIASRELYPIPLDVCVADTQAGMGYMIAQCVMNELAQRGRPQSVTTVVTTVLVDRNDPAFDKPTKPIGPGLREAVARAHERIDKWHIVESGEGRFRRLVPSPRPVEIQELETICRLVDAGELVVCCGGGGIPVCRDEAGQLRGVAAVVDKDYSTALLARGLDVSMFVILTAVDRIYVNFQKPDQRPLEQLTIDEARQLLADHQFGAGSMRPKIEAAIDFLTHSQRPEATVLIARLDKFADALRGESGTRITR
jgi:carbamate kinase